MSQPQHLHRLHEDLLRLSMLPQAPRIAAHLQARFVAIALEEGWPAWAAYGFSVAQRLAQTLPAQTLLGWSPEELSSLHALLARCLELETLDIAGAAEWPVRAQQALAHVEQARQALGAVLQGASGSETKERGLATAGGIWIPVVAEVLEGGRTELAPADLQTGQLLGLAIQLMLSREAEDRPRIVVEGELQPAAREAFEQAAESIRGLGPRHGPSWRQLLIGASWDHPGARITGGSAGLGFGLAVLSRWNALAPGWRERVLARNIAATGILVGSEVRPVEPATLGLKVRTCFYSAVQTLLVPQAQLGLAEEALAGLQRTHPARRLRLQALSDIGDVMARDRVFVTMRRTWRGAAISCAAATARSRAGRVGAAAALLTLAGLLAWVAVVTRNEPVAAQWEGDNVVLRNRHDWVTLALPVENEPPPVSYPLAPWGGPLHLWDLDGDRQVDLLALHGMRAGIVDLLSAFDRKGRLLWRQSAKPEPADGLDDQGDMQWIRLYGPWAGPAGAPGLLADRRSPMSGITYLEFLDGPTGRTLGRLRNEGHMEAVERLDLDGEGTPDIICLGTYMPEAAGLLAVLDLDALAGQSREPGLLGGQPTQNLTDPSSLTLGVRLALCFPKDRFTSAERVHCLQLLPAANGQVVAVVTGVSAEGAVLYTFHAGTDMMPRLSEVRLTDAYRSWIRQRGLFQPEIIEAELARLRQGVRMLTATGWRGLDEVRESVPEG